MKVVETGGKKATEQQREQGISAATCYIWKRKYGGLEVNEAKRLRALELENNKRKRMVANLMLENEAVKEVLYTAVKCYGIRMWTLVVKKKKLIETKRMDGKLKSSETVMETEEPARSQAES